MTITHRAAAESEHFSYEAFGSSEQGALDALREGFEEHAGQMGTADTWPDDMIAQSKVHAVGTGGSQFADFDLKIFGKQLVAPQGDGKIAYRSTTEVRHDVHGWGHADGLGATMEEAENALLAGLTALKPGRDDADSLMADATVYAIREGSAYRGGLVGPAGELLA